MESILETFGMYATSLSSNFLAMISLIFLLILFLSFIFSYFIHSLCPFCREKVKKGSLKCKHCGEFFDQD